MEFKRWWVLKNKIFGQESTFPLKKIFERIWSKTAQIVLWEPNFQCQESTKFLNFLFHFKNISYGDHFFEEILFSSFNSWTTLFSKIFDRIFLRACWFLAKKLLFRTHHLWNSTTKLILVLLHMHCQNLPWVVITLLVISH